MIKGDKHMNSERKKLIKIMQYLVKDYQRGYLKLKAETDHNYPNWRDAQYTMNDNDNIVITRNISKLFKTTQKVLEYLRKGHNYKYEEPYEIDDMFGEYQDTKISIRGRSTWSKTDDALFEITISDDQLKKYNSLVEREYKLKRILKTK